MLRLLIGTGLLLMAVGFGAAGWQYWRGLPASGPETALSAGSGMAEGAGAGVLISPAGGLAPRADAQAFLDQGRLVAARSLIVTRTAPLADLLADGESLPAAAFWEVMADIRAPRLAEGLCAVLTRDLADDCALNSARVEPGSIDAQRGTARFRLELLFRPRQAEGEMPDPMTRVFRTASVAWPAAVEDGEAVSAPPPATIEEAVSALAAAATAACGGDEVGEVCRVLGLTLTWGPDAPAFGQARIGWLDDLPRGVVSVPSLDPAPEG